MRPKKHTGELAKILAYTPPPLREVHGQNPFTATHKPKRLNPDLAMREVVRRINS